MTEFSLQDLSVCIYVLVLASFIGFEVISKVPTLLHTPLMSGSNAISGIVVLGAIMACVGQLSAVGDYLAYVSMFFATINVVGGFVVTDRMLSLFRMNKAGRK